MLLLPCPMQVPARFPSFQAAPLMTLPHVSKWLPVGVGRSIRKGEGYGVKLQSSRAHRPLSLVPHALLPNGGVLERVLHMHDHLKRLFTMARAIVRLLNGVPL